MELSEKSKTRYAEILRDRLRKRMPEHADRIAALPDDRIIEMDREHFQRKLESVRVRHAPAKVYDADYLIRLAVRKFKLER